MGHIYPILMAKTTALVDSGNRNATLVGSLNIGQVQTGGCFFII